MCRCFVCVFLSFCVCVCVFCCLCVCVCVLLCLQTPFPIKVLAGVLICLLLVFLLQESRFDGPSDYFGIMIDAGSTGE